MKGLVIGGVGIMHVVLAQFAIGGGMLRWYFERLAQRGHPDARTLVAILSAGRGRERGQGAAMHTASTLWPSGSTRNAA